MIRREVRIRIKTAGGPAVVAALVRIARGGGLRGRLHAILAVVRWHLAQAKKARRASW